MSLYVSPNYKTKKAFKEAHSNGENMFLFPPGLGSVPENGVVGVEGPWYPKPHTFYAEVTLKDGKIIKIK